MAIGPVQLIVLGFPHREFHGEIVSELERLRDSDTVRVIDALAVHKDAEGEIEVQHLSNLTEDEAIELSGPVGADRPRHRGRRGRPSLACQVMRGADAPTPCAGSSRS